MLASTTSAPEIEQDQSALPEHLVQLPGGEWTVWRWVGLRGAGFPAEWVLKLAPPGCLAASDNLIALEEAVHQARQTVFDVVNAGLDALRQNHEWHDTQKRYPLTRILQVLKTGKMPPALPVHPAAVQAALETLHRSKLQLDAGQADFRRSFNDALAEVSETLRAAAQNDRLCEAVIWQSRRAFHTGLKQLLQASRGTVSRNSQRRQHEELVANYIQRYCVKNDTIGFFGPMAWAHWAARGEAVTASPGPNLLKRREVYFEQWCIDALAEALDNAALRPWLAPRCLPLTYVSGTTLHCSPRSAIPISAGQAVILQACLQACDGVRTAKEVADGLIRNPAVPLTSEQAVYDLLDDMCRAGLIVWRLELPLELNPEQALRRRIERVEDEALRETALGLWRQLVAARDAVTQAAGDYAQLDRALDQLETTFTRLTGEAPTRAAGQMYAARTLVYEDCRRDVEVELGPAILDALGPPLSLLLTSARWLTAQTATTYTAVFKKLYLELAAETGSSAVNLLDFWHRVQPALFGASSLHTAQLVADLQERWEEVLALPEGQHQVAYSSQALLPKVRQKFNAPRAGWNFARYHSPDIMIAAAGPEAIRQGAFELVMGEIHVGAPTLQSVLFVQQHPTPDDLFRAVAHDIPQGRVMPVSPKLWPGITSRTRPLLVLPHDVCLTFTADAWSYAQSESIPVGALVVEDTPGGLVARTRDGDRSLSLIEVFAEALALQIIGQFKLLRSRPHSPRVSIDRLIVCREAWRCAASEMAFATEEDGATRFHSARRWARVHSIPRFTFVRTHMERKPFYVDWDSPISIDILAKATRRTLHRPSSEQSITITEMLPDFTQTWLPDADGQRYTSELRLVAVDGVVP